MRAEAATYPKRPKYFACEFVRLLTKKTVANELGPQAFTLLTVIAMTEDARGYSDPVTFYNPQLWPLVGVGSEDALDRVRAKCIAAGWLNYIPGGRRTGPGRYWVTVPEKYARTDDAPTDEPSDGDTLFRTSAEQTAEQSAEQTASKPRNLLPIPSPTPFADSSATVGVKPAAKKKAPPKEPTPRQPEPLFEALVEVTGTDRKKDGAWIAKTRNALAGAERPFTADDVCEFAQRWRELLPWAEPAKHPRLTLGIIDQLRHAIRVTGRAPPVEPNRIPTFSEIKNSEKAGQIIPHPSRPLNVQRT